MVLNVVVFPGKKKGSHLERCYFREDQVIVPKANSAFFHMTWIFAW